MAIFTFRKKGHWLWKITMCITSVLQVSLENISNNVLCGYIDFDSERKVNVYEGLGISSQTKFDEIYKKFTNTSTVMLVNNSSDCFIEICGHPTTLLKGQRAIIPSCIKIFKDNSSLPLPTNPFQLNYEATSIQCGCKKNDRPNCDRQDCDDLPFNETTICAVLHEEDNCTNCVFDGRRLSHNGIFNTSNSAVIRAAYVQPGCILEETAFGYSYFSPPDFSQQYFIPYTINHTESTQIVPMHTRRGQNFFCSCPKLNNGISHDQILAKLAWGLGSFCFSILFVIVSLLIKRHYWPRNKPVLILPKTKIVQFRKGVAANGAFQRESENQDDAAPGVLEACCAPYNSELEISRDHLEFNPTNSKSILGNGMFGIVFKGKYKTRISNSHSKKIWLDVAIKTVKPYSECGYLTSILNEVKVLSYLGSHPNIVQLMGACTNNLAVGEVYIVLELCSKGCLKNHLISIKDSLPQPKMLLKPNEFLQDYLDWSEKPDKPIEPPQLSQSLLVQLYKWSKEIATGMEFLAEKNVVHIDLAARNVLLTEDLLAKIGDFGLSRKLYAKQDYTKYSREPVPMKGNALECLTKKRYSLKSDVWSYGVILWEIFSLGDNPYENFECQEIIDFLNAGNRLSCPTYASLEMYKNTMMACWHVELEKRPSFSDMKEFFTQILLNYESIVVNLEHKVFDS